MSPACPRCGYDLSGSIPTWTESCPLEGTCSECGLRFRWGELLNPRLTIPRWSFEHSPSRRSAGRLARTFLLALRPSTFWRTLRLEHPVVVSRLLVYLFAVCLVAHGAVYGARVWLVYRASAVMVAPAKWIYGMTWADAAAQSLWPYTLGDSWDFLNGRWQRWMNHDRWTVAGLPHYFLLGWMIFAPLAFLALPETFRRVRVRYVHLVRAAAYSASGPSLVLVIHTALFMLSDRALGFRALGSGPGHLGEQLRWLVYLAGIAWLVWFWCVVPRRYLRVPHAAGVSVAMLTVGALASAVTVVLLALYDTRH